MRNSTLHAEALRVVVCASILAACSGGPQPSLAPQQEPVNTGPSWISPDASKTKDLLYVVNLGTGTGNVGVYSYPQGKLVETLTQGLELPEGVCTGKKGDVWIVNSGRVADVVTLYKHGGKTPVGYLTDDGAVADSCSVDPTTGNLAVTSYASYSYGPGSVAVYAHAKGLPTYYSDPKMSEMLFCGYDDKGNLFVDGWQNSNTDFQFAELPKGKKQFTNITLKGATIAWPGNVQWDGKHIAVGDQEYSQLVSAIYQTTGAGGRIVGKTVLADSAFVGGFWIAGNTVIAPDARSNAVGFYNYPAGGKPTKTLQKGFDDPTSVAISP
jgi:hypothetical protein